MRKINQIFKPSLVSRHKICILKTSARPVLSNDSESWTIKRNVMRILISAICISEGWLGYTHFQTIKEMNRL
jgi:hypothetical protein